MIPEAAVEAAALAISAHNGERFDVMARSALDAAMPHLGEDAAPTDGHRPSPGPSYWDFKCLTCEGLVADHLPLWARITRKLRARR